MGATEKTPRFAETSKAVLVLGLMLMLVLVLVLMLMLVLVLSTPWVAARGACNQVATMETPARSTLCRNRQFPNIP